MLFDEHNRSLWLHGMLFRRAQFAVLNKLSCHPAVLLVDAARC
jgi:hypothetical protein